jgi:hypothetical protein
VTCRIKILLRLIVFSCCLLQIPTFAADTTSASFNLSGTVPVVFSATTRGVPGDLDLSPNVIVNNRRIGLVHFKYNVNVASMTISSNTTSGGPESSTGTYSFQGGGFKVSVANGCVSVDPTFNTPFALTNTGTDVKSATANSLTTGIEEDCEILASWRGTNQSLPLAGVYSLTVNITMVSQ